MKLSVILPIYNEEKTIAFALESIIYQRVNFEYEIIVCDDCSTDGTAAIVKEYQKSFPFIKYYKNEKNLGNAKTFYNALKIASGKYFQVLDGDDFFSNWHKLQKAVDFLDNNPDYCAVAHESIYLLPENKIDSSFLKFDGDKVHKYSYDKIFNFYYHTSSFMFKNIFKNNLYDFVKEDYFRGDTIRLQTIIAITNEKVKYFNDYSSVYNFNNKGIWSSLNKKEQLNLEIDFTSKRIANIFSGFEKSALELWLNSLKSSVNDQISNQKDLNLNIDINDLIKEFYIYLTGFLYNNEEKRSYIFQNCNYHPAIDQILETIGRISLFKQGLNIHKKTYKKDVFAFIVCGFNSDKGCGIIKEILDFIKVFTQNGKKIVIFSTEIVETDEKIIEKYFKNDCVSFVRTPEGKYIDKIDFLIKQIYDLAPYRLYPYISDVDVVGAAVIQKHLAKEIIMSWVYDHGNSLAVSNSSIARYIAKNDSYYYTLKSINKHNIIDIIPPIVECKYDNSYKPFKDHKNLITACAAARSYKIETKYRHSYAEIIPKLLKKTRGIHYHFGQVSDEYKKEILNNLDKNDVDKDKIIFIDFEYDLPGFLLKNNIDLFIAPFPIGSIRVSIEANSVGIPILAHHLINRLFCGKHFLSLDNFYWQNENDFFEIIENISSEKMLSASKKVREFYEENNSYEVCQDLLVNLKSLTYDENKVLHKSFVELYFTKEFFIQPQPALNQKEDVKKRIGLFRNIKYKVIIFLFEIGILRLFISKNKIDKYKNSVF